MRKNKVYDYVVVLKNQHRNTIEKTGWLLSIFSSLPYAVTIYKNPDKWVIYLVLFVLLSLLTGFIIDKKKNKPIRFMPFLLVAGAGLLYLSPHFTVGVFYILAGISESWISKKTEIGFSTKEILITGIIHRKVSWSDLNNVVIKDGLLTMDYKNNSVFQAYTDDEEDDDYEVEDDEFNTYCRKNLM